MPLLYRPQQFWTIPLNGLGREHVPQAGAKAVTLGQMLRAGLPVPAGFVLTTRAFERFVKSAPDWEKVRAALANSDRVGPAEAEAGAREIKAALADQPVPAEVETAIRSALGQQPQARLWAVRSSATIEDGRQASFAGQHDSFLNVPREDIPARARQCWLSLFSPRALLYRIRNGISHEQAAMAVIIQEMVPAELAGVLFTADPVARDPNRVVIEGARGLGENVVGGRVAPDRVVLTKGALEIMERTSGEPNTHAMCLDDDTVRHLAVLSARAEHLLGGPLDVEWAVHGGETFLLQARPITGNIRAKTWEERQIWTNANAAEALPEVVTPLTLSILWPFLQKLIDNLMGHLGWRLQVGQLIGLIAGRPYFNINTAIALLRRLPLITPEQLGRIFGGAQEHLGRFGHIQFTPEDLPRLPFSLGRVVRGVPRITPALVRFSLFPGHESFNPARLFDDTADRIPPEQCADEQLLQAIHHDLSPREIGLSPAMRYMGIGATYFVTLHLLCERWFGAEGPAITGRLIAGLGTLNPAETGRELWQLAELAGRDAQLRRAVEEETSFATLAKRLSATEAGKMFLARWRSFMVRHGHHGRGEVELMTPRWNETPDVVLALTRNYLEALANHHTCASMQMDDLARQRAAQTEACLRRLSNPFQRALFRWTLRRAQCGLAIKENIKSAFVRRLSVARLLALELGRRLVQRGRCAHRDDIFFLTLDELRPDFLFNGKTDLRKTVFARRADYERNRQLKPPPVVFGMGDPARWSAASPEAAGYLFGDRLEGVPVSPGLATGRARVILEVSPQDRVLPGEILVAPLTDPGWSPYFLTAAGLVIDLGGMLSHGSILAREYGIPAVVNVGSATRTIRTGDLVQVDGERGRVTILERAGALSTEASAPQ